MDFVQDIDPNETETHFYIDTKKDVLEFVSNFDNYFATKKKILFECKSGRILEKTGTMANIYRKGIRCANTNKTSVFDYDFNNISIDENRLVMYSWTVEEKMWDLLYQCDDKEIIMKVLHTCENHEYIEGDLGDMSTISSSNMSEAFKECIRSINLAPKGYAGLLKPDEVHNHVIVPTKVFQSFRGVIGDKNVGDKFKVTKRGAFMREIDTTELYQATINKALDFFKEVGFDIPYEITVALFDNKEILGTISEGKIVLSDICIEKGVNEVVNTILEEFIHLKYGAQDETRAFQTAMLTEFISYMKVKNAYLL